MPNAIDLLRADHDRLRQILPKLSDLAVPAEERHDYLEAMEKELKMHSLVEGEIFYPSFKDAASQREDRDLCFESIEEHNVIDKLLPELKPLDAAGDAFLAKAKVLCELVEHHAGVEEQELFDRARALLGDLALQDLGDRIQRRKIELERLWEGDITAVVRRAQSAADKHAPSSVKDRRVEINRGEERR